MPRPQGSPNQGGGQSTPVRVALAGHTMYRSSARTKDQRFINCYVESIKNELNDTKKSYVVKRPGYSLNTNVGVTGVGRGIHYYNSKYYTVIGTKLYENTTEKQTLSTSTGSVGFCEFDNAGVAYLFLCDGTDGYVIDSSGTVTKVNQTYSAWASTTSYSTGAKRIPTVDNGYYYTATTGGTSSGSQPTWPTTIGNTVVDGTVTWTCTGSYGGFPSPHIPTPLAFDGYIVLAAASSQSIYNSDVDNAFGWSTGNFVDAEMFPDNISCLIRQNNMFIALGSYSGEFFFDAASASGSPFERNESAALQMGIAAPYATYQNEKFCMFISQSESGGRAIWVVEGFQPKKISTEHIERIIDAEGSSITSATGFGLRVGGHLFYVINLTNTSLVYDLEEKVWHEWQSGATGGSPFACKYLTDANAGKPVLLHGTNGKIYNLDPLTYQDDSVNIYVDIYTNKIDFDTMNRKFMKNLNFVGDLTSGDSITVYWSDDDYVTWSSGATLSLTSRPFFTRLGVFRRRAFRINHASNNPFRAESLEAEIDVGFS